MRKSLFAFGLLAAACSSSNPPTNFAGSYAVVVVSGANNCQFANWTEGNSTNMTVQFTQDGVVAQFTVPSNTLPGAYLLLVLGTNTFSGTVTGNQFVANYLGTKQATVQGTSCTYTVNTKLVITLDSNKVLSGTMDLTPVTNGDASCGVLNQCTNTDTVSGSYTGP